ncbi:MAG: hypothetical protein KGJ78_11625 [Alphaproteobacteria bacterium]|nr:hypothetical protein [Alphaproteobacteria bacterium]
MADNAASAYCADRIGVARLAKMAFDGIDLRPLWHELMDKATDDPQGAGMGMDLSIIAQLLGDQETGLAIQRDVLAYQRLYRSPCRTPSPRLRVLALAAEMDIGGNTPIEFLLEDSDVELTTLYVVPGKPWPSPLPPHDIAVVVAPDDDRAHGALAEIEQRISGWPTVMLNPPDRVRKLDRDRLFQALDGVRGLVIPETVRLSRPELTLLGETGACATDTPGFPLIVRPIGSHAGRGLCKVNAASELLPYLRLRQEDEFFLSPFIDYAGADGQFRKYRICCIGGLWFACHMAISEQWKIWYLNADMTLSAAKRAEEAHFMATFDEAFARRHKAALDGIQARMGLDYFMVDCAETKSGELLVFEADNTAIIHNMDPPTQFPYKGPQMRKIFEAFAAMLYRRVGKPCTLAA